MTVDRTQVLGLIETVEQEIGTSATNYDLSIVPTIRITGHVGGERVDDVYAPAFTMRLDRTRILPDPELSRSDTKTIGITVNSGQRFSLFELNIPVNTARWVSVASAAIALALAGLLAAFVFLGLGRGEPARIRAVYGSLIIDVAGAHPNEDGQRIRVVSIHDLARLARRDGGVIFHQESGPGQHRYFVPEGTVVYEYRPAVRPPKGLRTGT